MQKKIEIISKSSTSSVVDLPPVFRTPVRSDLISFVHKNVALNKRQPYAVNPNAGKNYSAEGWGTGRAVARVARIKGSGTRRAGQGAFANFCRGGHMAHPTNVRRRWQRKTPLNMRRLVTSMGISASAVAPIVESRGHRISGLKSIPLVVDNEMLQDVKKTKDAVKFLVELGLTEEMDKTKEVFIKSGKGKMRNRRYKVKKGPLIVYDKEICTKAFRNVQGVDMCRVDDLNVLELCPGGQPGRLVIWMKDAFVKLHDLFGDLENEANLKAGFLLTEGIASGDEIERIFHSCEVQAFIDEPCLIDKPKLVKNVKEIEKLNPYLSLIN